MSEKITVYAKFCADNYWENVVAEAVRRGIVAKDNEIGMHTLVGEWSDLDAIREELRSDG